MLIDMHAHSSGISVCCRIPADEVLKACKERGIDGIILTNHYTSSYLENGDADAFAKAYVDEYHYALECAKDSGVKVFFGVEVTMDLYDRVHLLVYGVDERFVLDHPKLYGYTQRELFELVREHGGALIQAHPMRRRRNVLLDTDYLDGVEVNSHPLYDATHLEELSEIAAQKGLMITSGGDYHADTKRPLCGAYLPDGISSEEIGVYLRTADSIEILCQEPKQSEVQRVIYKRGQGITG